MCVLSYLTFQRLSGIVFVSHTKSTYQYFKDLIFTFAALVSYRPRSAEKVSVTNTVDKWVILIFDLIQLCQQLLLRRRQRQRQRRQRPWRREQSQHQLRCPMNQLPSWQRPSRYRQVWLNLSMLQFISVMHPRPRLIDSLLDDVPYCCSRPDWGRVSSVAPDPVKESECRLVKKNVMLKLIGIFSVVSFLLPYAKNKLIRRHSEYHSYSW